MQGYQICQSRKTRKKRSWVKAVRAAKEYAGKCRMRREVVGGKAPKETMRPPITLSDPWMRGAWEDASCLMKRCVGELMQGARENVEGLAQEIGLSIMRMAMEGERSLRAEGSEREGYRWGRQPGYVAWGGAKIPVSHPRLRSFAGEEIPLESYERFQSEEKLGVVALRDMMRGVSTRNYEEGIEGLLNAYGIKRTTVSRHIIEQTREDLKRLMERDLKTLDLGIIFIDGIHFADTLLVVAMGVDVFGRKHTLGLWQGATENATVCKELLQDLIRRGLNPEKNTLFIIDGGKGMRAALDDVFGDEALVQRCQEHKKRNVVDHLPKDRQKEWRNRLAEAYHQPTYDRAKAALWGCVEDLRKINPMSARSLLEGMEETLTLLRLEVPPSLWRSLSTTNPLEACFSFVRQKTNRVTRWQGNDHAQRWAASALLKAESASWKKIRGWDQLWRLWKILGRKELDCVKAK